MPIVRNFQPRYAAVGAYARAGAAGVAQREDAQRAAELGQRYELAQQHMGLQREGMYQSAVARVVDSRNQALQNAAEIKARQEEANAGREHQLAMQQAGYEHADASAAAALGRTLEVQQSAAQLDQEAKKVQFDYELTKKGEVANAEANQALAAAKQWHQDGHLDDQEYQATVMSIEAKRAGIEKMPIPKRKTPAIQDELAARQHVDAEGNTFLMQPDGKIDFRPKAPPKPPQPVVSFSDLTKAMGDIRTQLTTFKKDEKGNDVEVPPTDEAIQQRLQSLISLHAKLQPQPAMDPTGGAAPAQIVPASAPPQEPAQPTAPAVPQEQPPAPQPAPPIATPAEQHPSVNPAFRPSAQSSAQRAQLMIDDSDPRQVVAAYRRRVSEISPHLPADVRKQVLGYIDGMQKGVSPEEREKSGEHATLFYTTIDKPMKPFVQEKDLMKSLPGAVFVVPSGDKRYAAMWDGKQFRPLYELPQNYAGWDYEQEMLGSLAAVGALSNVGSPVGLSK